MLTVAMGNVLGPWALVVGALAAVVGLALLAREFGGRRGLGAFGVAVAPTFMVAVVSWAVYMPYNFCNDPDLPWYLWWAYNCFLL